MGKGKIQRLQRENDDDRVSEDFDFSPAERSRSFPKSMLSAAHTCTGCTVFQRRSPRSLDLLLGKQEDKDLQEIDPQKIRSYEILLSILP